MTGEQLERLQRALAHLIRNEGVDAGAVGLMRTHLYTIEGKSQSGAPFRGEVGLVEAQRWARRYGSRLLPRLAGVGGRPSRADARVAQLAPAESGTFGEIKITRTA